MMPEDNINIPPAFLNAVHSYLKAHQSEYGGNYEQFFINPGEELKKAGLGGQPTERNFDDLCRIAGKMSGLMFLTASNETLSVLLKAVKNAFQNLQDEEKSNLFGGKKNQDAITDDDLLEIGLYEKVDNQPKSADALLLRHDNLQTIYASEHQRWDRKKSSLPEEIKRDQSVSQDKPSISFPTQQELYSTTYYVQTKFGPLSHIKTPSGTKYWDFTGKLYEITASKKAGIEPSQYFLEKLSATLAKYSGARFSFFGKQFGGSFKQSESSKTLHGELKKILDGTEKDNEKIQSILKQLQQEQKSLESKTQKQSRRLINLLTEAGFMAPDVLRCAEPEPGAAAAAQASRN